MAPPTHHGHPLRGLASFFCCAPDSSHVKAAIDVYTQALGMCPDHDDGLVARGAAFATTGRLRQAVQDLSQALSLNPHNDNASRYLKETRRCDRCAMLLSPRPVMGVFSNVSGTVRPTCEEIFRGGGGCRPFLTRPSLQHRNVLVACVDLPPFPVCAVISKQIRSCLLSCCARDERESRVAPARLRPN